MRNLETIKKICEKAYWRINQDAFDKKHLVEIELEKFTLVMNANVGDNLLFQAKIIELPEDIDLRNEMLLKAGHMVASLWSHTRSVCTIVDNYIALEQMVDEENFNLDTIIEILEKFLDDCDFFFDKLEESFKVDDKLSILMLGQMI